MKNEKENDFKEFLEAYKAYRKSKVSITLAAAFKEYETTILPVKAKSTRRNVLSTNKYFIAFLGEKFPIASIQKKDCEKFIHSIYKRAEYQAALSFRILRAEFYQFLSWEYISKNPFTFKQPRPKSKLPSFLTESEFNQLIGFVREPGLRNLYTVLFYTGIRAGEGVNIQLSDIDFINRTLIIRNKESFTTKSGKERIIPLNDLALQALRDQIPKVIRINSEDYIFWRIEPRIPLPVEFCSKKFKGYIRKAGLNSGLKLHSLRHSFCSNLVNRGVSLYTVQALAGHSSPNVTKIYSHFQDKTLIEAVNLLGKATKTKTVS
jgi:site-specific recombinase XerD